MRNLPGLKPTLRFLDRGATNARAKRGHVIPRHSASFRVIPRSSAAKKTTHPRFLFRVFRVFRGERWFPFENPVIEHVHSQLARAKAHATVIVPRVIPARPHPLKNTGDFKDDPKLFAGLKPTLPFFSPAPPPPTHAASYSRFFSIGGPRTF
jgi:hypothetical protein